MDYRLDDNIAGIVVLENGAVAHESYDNGCDSATAVHVFSVTKSVIALLYGIALDEGLLESVDQRVLDFFPDYAVKRGECTIQRITVRDLLTMTAPYKYRSAPYTKYFTSDDWVRASLDLLGGKGAVGEFRYAPIIGPDILSGILVRATGRPVLAFAQERLFGPLGIEVEGSITFGSKEEQLAFNKAKGISGWVADPQGVNTAGWGLTLTPRDMAKIGQLCLDGGIWDGRQLVSRAWLDECLREYARWNEIDRGYGYLWWIVDAGEGACAALGDGGTCIYFNRKKGLVVAIASLFKPRPKDRIDLIRTSIEPAFG
ncbi:serine hydrolase domain-containing protein [Eggerthella timonensis]|uniref:serine hydrolase domain-containing protein n=1 Tax=Eggerthella timonensis TaxID=1871008 RepID=UPI000C773E25|nr:serine hydrolase [Eggerthella timonensis]